MGVRLARRNEDGDAPAATIPCTAQAVDCAFESWPFA
jgi:hypothetical protein